MEQIKISLAEWVVEEVVEVLNKQIDEESVNAIVLDNRSKELETFELSPETVTIIVAGIHVLAVTINALLVYKGTQNSQIVVKGSNGREISFSKNTSEQERQRLLELANQLENKTIIIKK